MTKVKVPVNQRILNRRSSSVALHIQRIRLENSKRQIVPWWKKLNETNAGQVTKTETVSKMTEAEDTIAEDEKISTSRSFIGNSLGNHVHHNRSQNSERHIVSKCKNVNEPAIEQADKTASMFEFATGSNYRQRCGSEDPFEGPQTGETDEISKSFNHLLKGREISLDSVKPIYALPQSSGSKGNLSLQSGKPGSNIRSKSRVKENVEEKQKSIAKLNGGKCVRKIKTKQKSTTPDLKANKSSKTTSQVQNKKEEIDGEKLRVEHPEIVKQHAIASGQKSVERKTPFQILKRPLNTHIAKTAKEKSKSVRQIHSCSGARKLVNQSAKIKPESKNKSDKSLSSELTVNKETDESSIVTNSNSEKIHETEARLNKNTSGENCKEFLNAEMYISELNVLQIITDLESVCPEDAAIIIWLDDLPESILKLFRNYPSISAKDMESPAHSETHLKTNYSDQNLENLASPTPNICFPPATILKNLALDSKFGFRKIG